MFGDPWEDISHQYQGTWSRWLYLLLGCLPISATRSYKIKPSKSSPFADVEKWKPLKLRMFEDQKVNNTIKTDVWRSWEDISHQYQGTWSRWLYLLLGCLPISATRSYKIKPSKSSPFADVEKWKPLKLRMFEDQKVNNTIKTDVWRSWEDISHQYQGTWSRWLYLLLGCLPISATRSYKIKPSKSSPFADVEKWKPLKLRMFEDQKVNNTIKTDVWRSLRRH